MNEHITNDMYIKEVSDDLGQIYYILHKGLHTIVLMLTDFEMTKLVNYVSNRNNNKS